MIYIFVFLGEFGFELLNWQGVIRKFSQTLADDDKIVCCSRAFVRPLYEFSNAYIDIASVPSFRESLSLAYFAAPPLATSSWDSIAARRFDERVKADLRTYILQRLREEGILPIDPGEKESMQSLAGGYRFIFSSDRYELNGLKFGRPRRGWLGMAAATAVERLRTAFPARTSQLEDIKERILPLFRSVNLMGEANIYAQLDLENNQFVRIQPDLSLADHVARQLAWDVNEPYLLCQTRERPGLLPKSPERLPWPAIHALLAQLAKHVKIVLQSFHTGRQLDSYSEFGAIPNCYRYHCQSFPEQTFLIHHSAHCLFFTEGDFGSHIYVPPFMGRNVTVLAARALYELETAPIDFWNEHVFRFGGQILPLAVEDVFASPQATEALQRRIQARVDDHAFSS